MHKLCGNLENLRSIFNVQCFCQRIRRGEWHWFDIIRHLWRHSSSLRPQWHRRSAYHAAQWRHHQTGNYVHALWYSVIVMNLLNPAFYPKSPLLSFCYMFRWDAMEEETIWPYNSKLLTCRPSVYLVDRPLIRHVEVPTTNQTATAFRTVSATRMCRPSTSTTAGSIATPSTIHLSSISTSPIKPVSAPPDQWRYPSDDDVVDTVCSSLTSSI